METRTHRSENRKSTFKKARGCWDQSLAASFARHADTQRPKAPRLPCASYWSFPKQRLPHYCAVQHENARFKAKFFVTFSFALG
jgi:hypothetical protein